MKVALTIAGSDSSGGAGIKADLKTFQAHGVFGMSAITAVTVQNTQKVYAVQEITPDVVRDQILCLFEDAAIHAVKIGMVSSISLVEAIADALKTVTLPPVVLDFVPDAMLVRDDDGIQTGATVPPPPGPWDDCFSGVRQPVGLEWPDVLTVELRSSCRYWVAYTEPDHAACVEPQSGPPDAFNWAPEIVEPGAALTHRFEIRWR